MALSTCNSKEKRRYLPQDNASILESNDQVLRIFFQEGLTEHPPGPPRDRPKIQDKRI